MVAGFCDDVGGRCRVRFQSPESTDRCSNLIGWILEVPNCVNLQRARSCYVYLNIFNASAYFWLSPGHHYIHAFSSARGRPKSISLQYLSDQQSLLSTSNTTRMPVIPVAIFTKGKKHAAATKLAQSNHILPESQLESCLPLHPLPPAITRTEFGSNHNSFDTISARVYPSQGVY